MRSSSGAELEPTADLAPNISSEWKREANHRLAAHRARRGGRAVQQAALPGMEQQQQQEERLDRRNIAERNSPPATQSRSIADRVAARYAHAPTYSEILAAEARNAARAAEAAAVAAGEARDAAQAILVGLDVERDEQFKFEHDEEPLSVTSSAVQLETGSRPQEAAIRRHAAIVEATDDVEEPVLEEVSSPVHPLPAKLLEFPRELVAARKARPRLAEGPLREEYDRSAERSQLRIFEVEHEAISIEPVVEPILPVWSSIRLGSSPEVHPQEQERTHSPASHAKVAARQPERTVSRNTSGPIASTSFDLPLQTASLEDRIMAAVVDAALIAAGFLVFILVFVACTTHPPTGKPAVIAAGVAFFAFAVIYLLLFFNFGQDTPGMRYAKIALCTFDDENPTRQSMRRRLGALLLSASPLGLGILWAFFDDDRLGWHDRISRTYQRSYR